eukprot:758708-Hanusia_phi.AAC.6
MIEQHRYKEARDDVSRNVSTEKDALSIIAEYHQEIQRLLMELEAARTSGNASRMADIRARIEGLEHHYKLAKVIRMKPVIEVRAMRR